MFLFATITGTLFALSLLLINTFLNKWTYPLLYVWIDIIGAILIPQFWILANTRFTSRQAKRLFGPIGAASAFANIFIGFSIQYGIILPQFLLPVAAGGVGAGQRRRDRLSRLCTAATGGTVSLAADLDGPALGAFRAWSLPACRGGGECADGGALGWGLRHPDG